MSDPVDAAALLSVRRGWIGRGAGNVVRSGFAERVSRFGALLFPLARFRKAWSAGVASVFPAGMRRTGKA
ncbi:MAG: hypothetical protein OXE57_03135, partial [Alphaproteobacteria bacterium]|nr:hypothetical protein [Alphaproteobacteria bacterium]